MIYNCGVIMCNGCNNSYDKSIPYKYIKNNLTGKAKLEKFDRERNYDLILIIQGCSKSCADRLTAKGTMTVEINDVYQTQNVLKDIIKYLYQEG